MLRAIFDIGKTNKKFFLFDENLQIYAKEYINLPEIQDEEGFACEDVHALKKWVKDTFEKYASEPIYGLNFSTYGASFVHLDAHGEPITPLYNYTKPLEKEVEQLFFSTYNKDGGIEGLTGSFKAGFLNSGLQLFWLKHKRERIFQRVKTSLHLPQYLAYLFGQAPISEFTSIGCHTMLWDFEKKDYHQWVYTEKLQEKLAPIVPTNHYQQNGITVGVGVHDSSAALFAYKMGLGGDFALISTGTWSVSLFPQGQWSPEVELAYLLPDGSPVNASRVFLGKEYEDQLEKLVKLYNLDTHYFHGLTFQNRWLSLPKRTPKWIHLHQQEEVNWAYLSPKEDYFQLVRALVLEQVKSLKKACGAKLPKNIYVDGGFGANAFFMKLLANALAPSAVFCSEASIGTALGALLLLPNVPLPPNWFQDIFNPTQTYPPNGK